jgi:hypothetical protein
MTRFKIEAYADYLAEEKARLEEQLAEAARRLRAKVEALADGSPPLVSTP